MKKTILLSSFFFIILFTAEGFSQPTNAYHRSECNTSYWEYGGANPPWWYDGGWGNQTRPDIGGTYFVEIGHDLFPNMVLNGLSWFNLKTLTVNGTTTRTYGNEGAQVNGISLTQGIYINSTGTNTFNVPIGVDASEVAFQAIGGDLNFTTDFWVNANTAAFSGSKNISISGVIKSNGAEVGKITKSGSGTLTLTGGNLYTGLSTVSGGTLRLNKDGGTTIPTTNNVTIDGGTLQISSNQTLNNLTLSSGTLTVDNGITLTITGTFSYTSGTISSSGTIEFAGSALQTIPTGTYNSITINNLAGVTLGGSTIINGTLVMASGTLSVGSSKTLTVNGTADCGTNVISGGGSFVLGSSGTIKCGHEYGIFGNIATIGVGTYPASATYIFNGSVAQSVSGLLPNNITGTLTINNALGVSMDVDRTLTTGTLNLQSGNLKTRFDAFTTKNLTIGSGATITGGSATSFVDGPLIMTLTSEIARTFPIGKGTSYRPLIMNLSVGQNVTAEMYNTAPSGGFAGIGIDKISNVRYYSVGNPDNTNITVSIPWGADDGVSDLPNITAVYGANSTAWLGISRSGGTTGDATSGTVTGTFNSIAGADFTLGNITLGTNPLPVQLTTFTINTLKHGVVLSWKTATETQNSGWEIERRHAKREDVSGDNENKWEKIGFISGSHNSNSPKSYSYTDKTVYYGQYEYRLKQIDLDGTISYSETIKISVGGKPTEFSLYDNYPNPFNPSTKIRYSVPTAGKVTLNVYNSVGQLVTTLTDEYTEAGVYEKEFEASKYSSGIYYYELNVGNGLQPFRAIKKMLLIK